MKQTPLIRKTPLTERWVVITKYKVHGATVEAVEKFDVHDQVEAIIAASKKRKPKGAR